MLALVTSAPAVELDTDLPLLTAELPEARVVIWDDPTVDWAGFDAVVIRSAWDYHERPEQFLDWARAVARVSVLWNPVEVLVWNTDKRYLAVLAERGIDVTPTWFVPVGATWLDEPRFDPGSDLVVKPTVGAGSNGVVRTRGDSDAMAGHIARLHAGGRTAMVQPYLAGIEAQGETGLVYLGGEFSHAFWKSPILAAPDPTFSGPFADEIVRPCEATAAQLELGRRVIEFLPTTAYARIDLLPSADGPVVLEVELTEPSLFLECDEGAAARAAAVFRSLVR